MNTAIVIATLSLLLTAPTAAAAVTAETYAWTPSSHVAAYTTVDEASPQPARVVDGVVLGDTGRDDAGAVAVVTVGEDRAEADTRGPTACASGVAPCPAGPGQA